MGCSTGPGGRASGARDGLYYSEADLKPTKFKANIAFLKEEDVTTNDVRQSLGTPEWESTELRLMAYTSEKGNRKNALFLIYDANDRVVRHEVRKIKHEDLLETAAQAWFKSLNRR